MKDKKIKKVRFRSEKDIRTVDANGGKNKPPKWVEERYSEEKFQLLEKSLKNIIVEKKEDVKYSEFPVILQTKLYKEALAKTSKQLVNGMFQKHSLIGIKDKDTLIYKLDQKHLEKISKKINAAEDKKRIVASIESIEKYEININPLLKDVKKLKIKLIKQDNRDLEKNQEKILFELLEGFKVTKLNYSTQSSLYEVLNIGDFSKVMLLKNLPFVDSVEEMPELNLDLDLDFFKTPSIPRYMPEEEYPIVGLLDSGVNVELLKNWCIEEYSSYISEDMNIDHGNKVGSLLCFNHILNNDELGVGGCRIISCVVGRRGISESEFLINLRESLDRYGHKVKIWNLSLGSKNIVDITKFSDLAIELDALQKEYNVLFIKSTGNCEELKNSHINCGAESIRCLTIGSISPGGKEWTERKKISSFSKVGANIGNIIKPDLVYYGGDRNLDNDNCGIETFDKNGKLVNVIGTSFSTPRITSYVAHLNKKIGGEFDPLFLKTLVIHNANYDGINLEMEDLKEKYGYGLPSKLDDIFYEDEKQITMIFRGKIKKGKYIETLDLPYPESLIENGYYTGEIKLTASIDPILDATQGLEYCQTSLEVKFGVYSEKMINENKKSQNEIKPKDIKNILLNTFAKSKINKRTEENLRAKGKYVPIKKYVLDIENFTPAKKNELSSDKKWFIRLEPEYQLALDEKLKKEKKEKENFELDYCIILTIKSKDKNINKSMVDDLELREYQPQDIDVHVDNNIYVEV